LKYIIEDLCAGRWYNDSFDKALFTDTAIYEPYTLYQKSFELLFLGII